MPRRGDGGNRRGGGGSGGDHGGGYGGGNGGHGGNGLSRQNDGIRSPGDPDNVVDPNQGVGSLDAAEAQYTAELGRDTDSISHVGTIPVAETLNPGSTTGGNNSSGPNQDIIDRSQGGHRQGDTPIRDMMNGGGNAFGFKPMINLPHLESRAAWDNWGKPANQQVNALDIFNRDNLFRQQQDPNFVPEKMTAENTWGGGGSVIPQQAMQQWAAGNPQSNTNLSTNILQRGLSFNQHPGSSPWHDPKYQSGQPQPQQPQQGNPQQGNPQQNPQPVQMPVTTPAQGQQPQQPPQPVTPPPQTHMPGQDFHVENNKQAISEEEKKERAKALYQHRGSK